MKDRIEVVSRCESFYVSIDTYANLRYPSDADEVVPDDVGDYCGVEEGVGCLTSNGCVGYEVVEELQLS